MAASYDYRKISFISNDSSVNPDVSVCGYGDGDDIVGDIPKEDTPLLTSTKSRNLLDVQYDKPNRNRSQSRIGSFLSSIGHTISTSVLQLKKSVGFLQGFTLLVGILIGSGVFISPSLVMANTKDAGLSFVIWLGCGIIALGGSLCYCELGCAIKKAGGNYAYILEAYGDLPAFLCCWTVAFIIDPAGVAAMTLTLGTYAMKPFEHMIEPSPWYAKAISAGCILLIAFINCWSVRAATRAQTMFVFAQVSAVLFVVVLGCWQLGEGHTQNLKGMFNVTDYGWHSIGPLGAALYNGLWAFDGWAMVCNVTEEMKNLERNLFLSIVTAIPFVICCYMLINLSFLSGLTVKEISKSPAVAVTFVHKVLGKEAAFVMPVLVALSCYGAANGTIFACGRLSLAAGREGHLPELFSMIHKKRRTPIPAVIMTSIISMLMLIPDASSLETLIGFFNFSCWFIYGISIFAVVVLRIKKPDLHRPYKVWLLTPILMTLVSLFLVIVPFISNPVSPAIALGLILLGIPVYIIFIYFEPKHPNCLIRTRERVKKCLQRTMNLGPCAK